MNIRVERNDGRIITIDLTGEWRVDPSDLHSLVGQGMRHVFTPEGYYDGSPGAERFIRWRTGDRLLAAAAFAGRFHRPDRVLAALRIDQACFAGGAQAEYRIACFLMSRVA